MSGLESRLGHAEDTLAQCVPSNWAECERWARILNDINRIYGDGTEGEVNPADIDPELEAARLEAALDRIYGKEG